MTELSLKERSHHVCMKTKEELDLRELAPLYRDVISNVIGTAVTKLAQEARQSGLLNGMGKNTRRGK